MYRLYNSEGFTSSKVEYLYNLINNKYRGSHREVTTSFNEAVQQST